jgi:hypothetical protein
MQQLITKPHAKVQDKTMWGVVHTKHNKVKAAMARHPRMVCENYTDSGLPWENSTATIPQTHLGCRGKGAPSSRRAPTQSGTQPAAPDVTARTQCSEKDGVPPAYVYKCMQLHSVRFMNFDLSANNRMHVNNFIPDLLTDDGVSTGYETISCMVMQLTAISGMTATCWVNLIAKMGVD